MKSIKYLVILVFFQSCASGSFKEKTYRNMLIASVVGAVAGQSEDNHKLGYSVAYAGTMAALAAVGSIEAYDPDNKLAEQIKVSKDLAKSIENRTDPRSSENMIQGLKSYQNMPTKYKELLTPGQWKITQIDEWEKVSDNLLIHKNEMIELIPPQFNINENQ